MTNDKTDFYVPMNVLFKDKESGWTFTEIHMPYEMIAKEQIVIWCVDNMMARWTMLRRK